MRWGWKRPPQGHTCGDPSSVPLGSISRVRATWKNRRYLGGPSHKSHLFVLYHKKATLTHVVTNLQGPHAWIVPCRNITNKIFKKSNSQRRIERAIGDLYGDRPSDPSPLLLLLLLLPLHTTLNIAFSGTYHFELQNVSFFFVTLKRMCSVWYTKYERIHWMSITLWK